MAIDGTAGGNTRYADIKQRAKYLADKGAAAGVSSCPPFVPGADNEGDPTFYYVSNEVVLQPDAPDEVVAILQDLAADAPYVDEFTRATIWTVRSDALAIAQRIKTEHPEVSIGPHHVLVLAPRPQIGPGSDPRPTDGGWRPGQELNGDTATIAVIDTGFWHEPDAPGMEDVQRIADDEAVDVQPRDGFVDWYGVGHGGFIAGVLRSRVGDIEVLSEQGVGGDGLITEQSVSRQIDEALAKVNGGPVIVNLSLGSYRDARFGTDLAFLSATIRELARRGVLVVAAAGNDGSNDEFYPAALAAEPDLADCVVSVGALESLAGGSSRPAEFSNFGRWVTAWAPGADIVSHYPCGFKFRYEDDQGNGVEEGPFDAGLAQWSGTSFAAPYAAAEIARYAAHRGLTPQEAWAEMRRDRPFVVFGAMPDEDAPPTR